jgi:fatty acid desaturase
MDEVVFRHPKVDRARLKALASRSDAKGLRQLAGHLLLLAVTGFVVSRSVGSPWLVPALLLHGAALVFLFAPLHECIHRTAFRSIWLNDLVAWVCGAVLVLPPTWFRHFHFAHHRWTQDPARDPELARAKPVSVGGWLLYVSGMPYWRAAILGLLRRAAGRFDDPFVPARARRGVIAEARIYLLVYATVAAAGIGLGTWAPALYWAVPVLLAQPLLRLYLLAEHTGCPLVPDMLRNTRTTLTNGAVRLLAWNMPYHAEHHAFPAVPFHALPQLHAVLRDDLVVVAPGYVTVHRELLANYRRPEATNTA